MYLLDIWACPIVSVNTKITTKASHHISLVLRGVISIRKLGGPKAATLLVTLYREEKLMLLAKSLGGQKQPHCWLQLTLSVLDQHQHLIAKDTHGHC